MTPNTPARLQPAGVVPPPTPFEKGDVTNSKPRVSARKPAARIRSQRKSAMGLPPEFPLFPHKSGRWAKKVRGVRHHFGKVEDDPKGEAALRKWLDEKDDLLAGRTPRTKSAGLTVGGMCDRFLQAKDSQLTAGEITRLTRNDYEQTTDRIVAHFGKNRLVTDLASDDFEALRSSISKTRGPVAGESAGSVVPKRARLVDQRTNRWRDAPRYCAAVCSPFARRCKSRDERGGPSGRWRLPPLTSETGTVQWLQH